MTFYGVAAVLGLLYSPLFYAVLLLDWGDLMGKDIENVYRAARESAKTIVQLLGFALLIAYVFSIIAYFQFGGDTEAGNSTVTWRDDVCNSFRGCFFDFANMALQARVGELKEVGSTWQTYSESGQYWMIPMDWALYIVFTMLLTLLILGVIVDTFSELRNIKSIIEDKKQSECFFCGLHRNDMDHSADFHEHKEELHNMWDYVAFFAHLFDAESKSVFTGIESRVYLFITRTKIDVSHGFEVANPDLEFFPRNRADHTCMGKVNTEQTGVGHLHADSDATRVALQDMQLTLNSRLDKMQPDMQTRMDHLKTSGVAIGNMVAAPVASAEGDTNKRRKISPRRERGRRRS